MVKDKLLLKAFQRVFKSTTNCVSTAGYRTVAGNPNTFSLFEGMKAYRGIDNRIRIFRPDMNMKRMQRTAARACLPTFDGEELVKCIMELLRIDQEWIPYSASSSLYIRPTLIGTDPHLGVAQSKNALLYVVTGPVGTFFDTGFQPVSLYADSAHVRAWPGGVGACKMGSSKFCHHHDWCFTQARRSARLQAIVAELLVFLSTKHGCGGALGLGKCSCYCTKPHLGIGQSHSALLYVIMGPVGNYFASGLQPISLLADSRFVRAFPGGTGDSKLGCNYGPTILIGKIAQDNDCQQVLWLFGPDQLVTEVGTMNIFLVIKNENGERELITPPLEDGLILPGVTRQSILDLSKEWNEFKVTERNITMKEVLELLKEKRLVEMFGSGTACIVSPVDRIRYAEDGKLVDFYIPTMDQNPCLMQKFYDAVTDIQYGRVARPDWARIIDEELSDDEIEAAAMGPR